MRGPFEHHWIPILFLAVLCGCGGTTTLHEAPAETSRSLPGQVLARYSDPFDTMRWDLWDKTSLVYTDLQLQNFQFADMRIEGGRLRIETKTGCFSKGGIQSRYLLSGDFDIQVDCHLEFLEGDHDMDQSAGFAVMERKKAWADVAGAAILFARNSTMGQGILFSNQRKWGRWIPGNRREIDEFHGALRFSRTGKKISLRYRPAGESGWRELDAFRFPAQDLVLGIVVQNFIPSRTSIRADVPFAVEFDNFRINAAQKIEEEEI